MHNLHSNNNNLELAVNVHFIYHTNPLYSISVTIYLNSTCGDKKLLVIAQGILKVLVSTVHTHIHQTTPSTHTYTPLYFMHTNMYSVHPIYTLWVTTPNGAQHQNHIRILGPCNHTIFIHLPYLVGHLVTRCVT